MDKFGRSYFLQVEDQGGGMVEIQPPFTIDFDVFRNKASSANITKIRIYNLAEKTRNNLLKNPNMGEQRLIILRAGYGDNLPQIVSGYINSCYSTREGTNFVTTVESFDAGFAYANAIYKGPPFPVGTSRQIVIETLIKALEPYGVGVGAISRFPESKLTRALAVNGSITDELSVQTNGRFFIDNAKAYALTDLQTFFGDITKVNYETGLLNTPVRHETYLNFDLLFEPRLVIGQQLTVESLTAKNYNGRYQVLSIHHRGTISDSIAGDARTSVGCVSADQQTFEQIIGYS